MSSLCTDIPMVNMPKVEDIVICCVLYADDLFLIVPDCKVKLSDEVIETIVKTEKVLNRNSRKQFGCIIQEKTNILSSQSSVWKMAYITNDCDISAGMDLGDNIDGMEVRSSYSCNPFSSGYEA
ncbi:MAG: hypothetical protein JSS82_03575 [Bacteroidetes bacterium]|nr:hypothetical protein [Bacteroidota bacterium]